MEFETVEIPVRQCKRGRKSDAGKLFRNERTLLERVEFAPDNSRIGNESRGLQSDTRWNGPLTLSQHGYMAHGIVPFAIIGSELPAAQRYTPRKPYGCASKPLMLGTAVQVPSKF